MIKKLIVFLILTNVLSNFCGRVISFAQDDETKNKARDVIQSLEIRPDKKSPEYGKIERKGTRIVFSFNPEHYVISNVGPDWKKEIEKLFPEIVMDRAYGSIVSKMKAFENWSKNEVKENLIYQGEVSRKQKLDSNQIQACLNSAGDANDTINRCYGFDNCKIHLQKVRKVKFLLGEKEKISMAGDTLNISVSTQSGYDWNEAIYKLFKIDGFHNRE